MFIQFFLIFLVISKILVTLAKLNGKEIEGNF